MQYLLCSPVGRRQAEQINACCSCIPSLVAHKLAPLLLLLLLLLLLRCCSKFETGYDDPRLGAMFVDRCEHTIQVALRRI
jgi:hypothetical protein